MTGAFPVSNRVQAWILLSITCLCWGANALFARLAVGEVSPMALVTLRWLGVIAVLAVIARPALRADWPRLRPYRWRLALMGTFGFTAFNALYYVAAHHTTAINMGILQSAMPLFVVLGAWALWRTPLRGLQLAGIALGICGVVLVAAHGDIARLRTLDLNGGDVMVLGACTLYAGYMLALRGIPPASALGLFAVVAGAAALSSLPLAVAEWLAGDLQMPTGNGWLLILAVALLPSLLGQVLFIRGVELIGPARAGVFVNLVPIVAALLAVLVLDEAFRWFHATALAAVLGGIWLSEHGNLPAAGARAEGRG